MDETTIIQITEGAICELLKEQIDHLKRGRVERTFTTDLANKLRPLFEKDNITVDAFYNRHENATKRLSGKVIELDIAIHQRGVDEHNLIAIELETINKPKRDDIWKLEGLTQELGGYGYRLGLFLAIGVSEKAGEIIAMEWYKNGQIL